MKTTNEKSEVFAAIETRYKGYRMRSRIEESRAARFEHGETPNVTRRVG